MLKSQQYRECAADCLRLAERSHDPADRTILISMAERWHELAERAAEYEGSGRRLRKTEARHSH